MRRVATLVLLTGLAFALPAASSAATPKPNTPCTKAGQSALVKGTKLVCTKVGTKKTWKVTATPADLSKLTVGWLCSPVGSRARNASGVELICVSGSDGKSAWADANAQQGSTGPTPTPQPSTAKIGWVCQNIGEKAKTAEGVEVTCSAGADGKGAWIEKKVYGPKDAGVWGMVRDGNPMNCHYSDGNQGFRILKSFQVDSANPKKMIVGVEFEGVFRSEDGGATWTRSSAGLWSYPRASNVNVPCITELSRIVVDPADANHMLISRAGGSRTITEYFGENHGIYESKDGGRSWKQILLDPKLNIGVKHALCFAGANGTIYAGTSMDPGENGKVIPMAGLVIKTTDGGKNWSVLKTGVGDYYAAHDLYCSKSDPNFLIVATMQRLPGKEFNSGLGLIQSTDGGTTWTTLNPNVKIAEISVSSNEPKNISIIQYDQCTPSYSTDGGKTFTLSSGLNCMRSVYYDRTDASGKTVWATSDEGRVYKSTDAGASYSRLADLPGYESLTMYGSMIEFGSDGAVYVAGHYKGTLRGVTYQEPYIFRTTDGGSSWTRILGPDRIPDYVGIKS